MHDVDIFLYDEPGYRKLFHFNSWRIAMLNHIEELEPDRITYVEAHMLSDEAFVLLEGNCTIVIAMTSGTVIAQFMVYQLQKNTVFTVRKGVFHTQILSKDAKVLIIEEESTAPSNSPRITLDSNDRARMRHALEEERHV